ncbi:hypothetical protein M7I_7612 [Glarea lozoyensis 74030]|uniref:Uncharacterized protein n=1 Tax=Glarea lozoyensis (strain ATCC 74030 / MF5533) TaxID=1104152 RepID=H0EXS3_GLAL7|nr:hypothetical protein M7I_7612 [Glarea lozoyensis 74030]
MVVIGVTISATPPRSLDEFDEPVEVAKEDRKGDIQRIWARNAYFWCSGDQPDVALKTRYRIRGSNAKDSEVKVAKWRAYSEPIENTDTKT